MSDAMPPRLDVQAGGCPGAGSMAVAADPQGAAAAVEAREVAEAVRTVERKVDDALGRVRRVYVAVHGIGDQSQFETIQQVVNRLGKFFDSPSPVPLGSAQNLGDVIKAINTAGAGKVKASFGNNAKGITLTDLTTGGGSLSVADGASSHAATDTPASSAGARPT